MKSISKYFYILLAVSTILVTFSSCNDDKDEYGLKQIYMPQAAIYNGGLTNEYPVPMPNMNIDNYIIDDEGMLHVYMGVYRSGEGEYLDYKVNVYLDDAAGAEVAANTARGVQLDSKYISLPDVVEVASGSRQKTFHMVVDLPTVIAEHPEYKKNKIIAVVGISDPSRWELNEALSRTTVVIEGSVFMPAMPILKHGDFGPGASESWTLVNVNKKSFELMTIDESKGELQIDVDNYAQYGGGDSRWMCWQKLESDDLEVGSTYIMSCNVDIPAQNFVMTDTKNNLKREMDFGFAIFPKTANMATQNDYKPSDSKYWYMDVSMDNGKGHYPLYEGTDGFKSFAAIHNNHRPDGMSSGEFTLDADHMGGYIVFYVRLRNACPGVKTIRVKDVQIVAK